MKLISLEELKTALAAEPSTPDIYYVPEGRLLSPAAKDYLNVHCIRFDKASRRPLNEQRAASGKLLLQNYTSRRNEGSAPVGGNHGNLTTGSGIIMEQGSFVVRAGSRPAACKQQAAAFVEKPEFMTHTYGNRLVYKDDPLIAYRGKLDATQAQMVFVQSLIAKDNGCPHLLSALDDILETLRELMRAEVLNEPLRKTTILGLTPEELRERSHHPEQYYGVKQMALPSYEQGPAYAGLNLIRTSVREAEVLAVQAFRDENSAGQVQRTDILQQLNRLSSALHILMCRYMAGDFRRP